MTATDRAAKARSSRTFAKHIRWGQEMTAAGWAVTPPIFNYVVECNFDDDKWEPIFRINLPSEMELARTRFEGAVLSNGLVMRENVTYRFTPVNVER